MQRWRCPPDYYWEARQNKYLRKPATMIRKENDIKEGKTGGGATAQAAADAAATNAALKQQKIEEQMAAEERRKREARDYDRPWLHNFLSLAADEIRFEQELLKQNSTKAEVLKLKWKEKEAKHKSRDHAQPKDYLAVSSKAPARSALKTPHSHRVPKGSALSLAKGDVSDTMSEAGSTMSKKRNKHGKKGRARMK